MDFLEKQEIFKYLASIGIRAENNKQNIFLYQQISCVIYTISIDENSKGKFTECLHFLDCVAQNILDVKIYNDDYNNEPKGEYFKKIYIKLKQLKLKYLEASKGTI